MVLIKISVTRPLTLISCLVRGYPLNPIKGVHLIYKQVKINLTPSHYLELEEQAISSNKSIAQLIRDKLGIDFKTTPKALQRTRKVRSDKREVTRADPQLLYHLSKIGTNLNQISKHLNSTKVVDSVVISSLIEIQEELKKL